MIIFGRKKVVRKDNIDPTGIVRKEDAAESSYTDTKPEGQLQTGTEYAVWCLRNIQDLNLHQCDLLYRAASEKKFTYDEIRSLMYKADGMVREEADMETQFEKIIHVREQARMLERLSSTNKE